MDDEQEVVAYTLEGKPLTKKEYIERNQQAEDSYKKGNFKTQEEMLAKYRD